MRDSDIRRAVKAWLTVKHAHDVDTCVVEEMNVWSGSARIDIAVVNGSLNGYELKSNRDTLDRLPRQLALYGRVFDYLFLVVGIRHAEKAQNLLPDWWGIEIAVESDTGIQLVPRRAPSQNPSLDPYLIAELLSKEEAIGVLQAFGLDKGWKSKKIRFVHERLANELSLDELRKQVRSVLKARPRNLKACQCERE